MENTNQFNDVAFAIHALMFCCITASQFSSKLWGFQKRSWRAGKPVWGIIVGCIVGLLLAIGLVLAKGKDQGNDPSTWAWIDVVGVHSDIRRRWQVLTPGQVYGLGSVKLIVSVLKYIPQAWANYRRKSTAGWSINQILLDVIGGVLSIAQLVIDSSLQSDWSGIKGNPVKFGLGNISIFFDVIFILQHYVLYGSASPTSKDARQRRSSNGESERPLLVHEDEASTSR